MVDLCRRFPAVGWTLVPALAEGLQAACHDFRRLCPVEAFAALLHNRQWIAEDPAAFDTAAPLMVEAVASALQDMAQSSAPKAKHARSLLQFAAGLLRTEAKVSPPARALDRSALVAATQLVYQSSLALSSKPVQNLCRQILQLAGAEMPTLAPPVAGSKRRPSEPEAPSAPPAKKAKNAKKGQDTAAENGSAGEKEEEEEKKKKKKEKEEEEEKKKKKKEKKEKGKAKKAKKGQDTAAENGSAGKEEEEEKKKTKKKKKGKAKKAKEGAQ